MLETGTWLGFEDEDHEWRSGRAEYADFDAPTELPPDEERAHAIYVRRVAAEFGFPLSDWQPTIPGRARAR